jgi:hypothetical protein
MIIYSVIPNEVIFEGLEDFDPRYEEISMDGITLQVERRGQHQAAIVRLLSYDPQDYLNPKYAPGSIIEYNPSVMSTKT